jgi:SWI/SNF-related matrix-associated actin-dependent regulator 1 of chromatin subfamily A
MARPEVTLELVNSDIRDSQFTHHANTHTSIETILYCCFLLNRYPSNAPTFLRQVEVGDYNHIGGLTYTGHCRETPLPLFKIADGLILMLKKEQGMDYHAWRREMNDSQRNDMMLGGTIKDRNSEIERLKKLGYTHQIYRDEIVISQNRCPNYQIIGRLDEALRRFIESNTLTGIYWAEDMQSCTFTLFMGFDYYDNLIKEFAYKERYGIHNDLLFFWESRVDTEELPESDIQFDQSKILRQLFTYQTEGVKQLLRFKRSLLADDMGLGKTLEAITTIHLAEAWPCLFVVPAVMQYKWVEEIYKATGISAEIFHPKRGSINLFQKQALVVSYGQCQHLPKLAEHYRSIVVDESHYVKDRKTKRYDCVYAAAADKEYRILITGTPIMNHTIDLVPQLTILGYLNQQSAKLFKNRYCNKDVKEYALSEMNTKLRNMCMVRRLKSEVEMQLPPISRTIISVDITNRKEYNAARTDIRNYLEKFKNLSTEEITQSMRAEALIRVSNLKRLAAAGCRTDIVEFCKNVIDQGHSILVFCTSKDAIEYYSKALETDLIISGATSMKRREEVKNLFQNDPTPCACIISIRAGGVGLDLTKANYVVHVEKDWVPAIHDQGRDRAHRIGQEQHVFEYFYSANDTIDAHIMDIMNRKREIADIGTGGNSLANTATSVYKDVMREYFGYDITKLSSGTEEEPDPA